MHKFSENLKPTYGGFSSALGGEGSDKIEAGTFVHMDLYDKAIVYAQASGVASGQVVTLTILEATASNGGGSATTAYTDTFTATATNHTDVLQAEIKADQLSAGYDWVGYRLATGNASGTEKVSAIIIQGNPRYGQNVLP